MTDDVGRCGTCRHWHKGAMAALYPGVDPDLGNCDAIGDERGPDVLALANSTEGLGGAWVETRAEFGCVLHAPTDHPDQQQGHSPP